MKKGLITALSFMMILGLAVPVFAGPKGEASGSGKKKIVAYIAMNTLDTFHVPIKNKATEMLNAYKANGTIDDWKLYDGEDDPLKQVSLMDTALAAGCNYFVLIPAEASGSSPVVEKAKTKGLNIVVVNCKTTNTDALADAYVGSNDVTAGEMMAQWAQSKYPGGGSYGHITGPVGNSAAIERGQGVHNILDKDTKWTMIGELEGKWKAELAIPFAEDWNNKYKQQLKAVICDNDDMAVGVRNVMNQARRGDLAVIGVDGNINALKMIKSGDLEASIYQDGVGQISKGIELLIELVKGNPIPKTTMIPFVLVDKSNIDKYLK
jgi:ABC-type sugar transport system substrate-binding protein